MSEILQARLARLTNAGAAPLFAEARRGVEKESLRVATDGYIAATPHPRALGSALTNAYITTDFSEALLEFVTPPLGNGWEVIQFLCDLHQFAQSALGDEVLWCMSMPCMIRSDADIPLARYGSSNVGTMKTVYRRGLGYRYGRYMQAISGVHFNYSLPDAFWPLYAGLRDSSEPLTDFRSAAYLGLVRNVRRLDWLLLYLFGASPAVCKSFLRGRSEGLEEFDGGTVYGPWATSLRMSDIGYQNTSQARLEVSANSLDEYIRDLSRATRTPNAEYERTGVVVDGIYRQLSANQLQIENEYYSTIRPKRVAFSGERPTAALARGGIEYVELRALDVSPFDPVGIHESQMRFLEVFLVCCLLSESPPIDDAEQAANARNHVCVARSGRAPGLTLVRDGRDIALEQWAREAIADMQAVAEFMDPADAGGYRSAVDQQLQCVNDPSRVPSARLLSELRETGLPLFTYAMQLSRSHAEYFAALDPATNVHWQLLTDEAQDSLQRQAAIEAADELSFDEYLRRYFA